jgi:hypothetical protein
MLLANSDVLKFGRIREREVRVPEGFVAVPCDEIEAVALIEPRQAELARHALDLGWRERTDEPWRRIRLAIAP